MLLKTDEPATRSSVDTYNSIFGGNKLARSLSSGLPAKPEQIKLADTFTSLRASQGVTDLETSLSDLQAQARDIQAISKARTAAEKGQGCTNERYLWTY